MAQLDWNEVADLDALDLAEKIRQGELDPTELLDANVAAIETINPKINAVVHQFHDRAKQSIHAGLPDGPLRGVPFVLKDLLGTLGGEPCTYGSRYLRDYVPQSDGELVRRLKRAGLVIHAKTNTPEYGILPTTEPKLFGPCRNPWNPDHSTGGSSGGSAAAVAARLVPAGHANDGGGSIRLPASCCGLFGLKPTRARNPLGPDFGDLMAGCIVEHAVTRSVRDSAALLDATAGPDVGDPYFAPPQERPYLEEVSTPPGKLRVGFSVAGFGDLTLHPDCVAATRATARLLEDLGHEVCELEFDLDADAVNQAFTVVYAAGHAAEVDGFARILGRAATPEEIEPLSWALQEMGRSINASQYLLAVEDLQRVSRVLGRMLSDYDVLLTTTIPEPPPRLGEFDGTPDNPLQGLVRGSQIAPFTAICNFSGLPAMSVPLAWNDAGLPLGQQFIGRFGDEATLFRLAGQLEGARPWKDRKPPISAGR